MRWNNPVSGVVEGTVFVWTSDDGPMAIAKCHINEPKAAWGEAIHSLAPEPIAMTFRKLPLWAPAEAGLKYFDVPNAPAPAVNERARLLQMRAIVRRFRVVGNWGESDPSDWQLRLLSEPLYRYKSAQRGVDDGAIFAFTQGTNPEAIAVVEAVRTDAGTHWQAAVTRLTKYGIRARFDDRLVADLPRVDVPPRDSTHYHGWHPFARYPFGPEPKSPIPPP